MSDSLVIVMNLQRKAPSQYINQPFTSVIDFNGDPLFFGPDGIYLESGDLDGTEEINAWVDTPILDFGNRQQKSIEAIDIGYEAGDTLQVTLYGDEDENTARVFSFLETKGDQPQRDNMLTLKKYRFGKARYWKLRVANTLGCDFSLDYLAVAQVFLKRRGL